MPDAVGGNDRKQGLATAGWSRRAAFRRTRGGEFAPAVLWEGDVGRGRWIPIMLSWPATRPGARGYCRQRRVEGEMGRIAGGVPVSDDHRAAERGAARDRDLVHAGGRPVVRHLRARRAGALGAEHPGGAAGPGADRGGERRGRGPGGGPDGRARPPCRGAGPIAPEVRLGRGLIVQLAPPVGKNRQSVPGSWEFTDHQQAKQVSHVPTSLSLAIAGSGGGQRIGRPSRAAGR